MLMRPHRPRRPLHLGILGAVVLLGTLVGGAANAQDITRAVSGKFNLQYHPPGSAECGSWAGACLTGRATGDLAGTVFIEVYPSITVQGSSRTLSASQARISISRPDGRLDGVAAGVLDVGTGDHNNVTDWNGGTGRYATAKGWVVVTGPINLSTGQEHSSYLGTLVL